jgi:hypothetical protein
MTKLFITDQADPSVGAFEESFVIECPFERVNIEDEELEFFKNAMIEAYQEFAFGKIVAEYDFENTENI